MATAYSRYELDPVPEHYGLIQKWIETNYGTLNVYHSKRTRKRVTLFLHGSGGNWYSWTPLLQACKKAGYRYGNIILLDLPGFGSSLNSRHDLDAEPVGKMLIKLVHDLGWQEIDLIGQSMGGFLAIDMASRGYPLIKKLTTISGAYYSVLESSQHIFLSYRKHPEVTKVYSMMWGLARLGGYGVGMARKLYESGDLTDRLGGTVAYPERLNKSIIAAIVDGLRPRSFIYAARNGKNYDTDQWLKINVPTTIIFGATDKLVPPSDGERFKRTVLNSKLVMIPHAGHFTHIEQPDKVAKVIFG